MATIQDVARQAGVSIATVSRVLNNSAHKVNLETRDRVLKTVKELDYRPNALARSLQLKKTMTIGIIIPDISNHYYAEIVRGIQNVADQKGYNIILQNTERKPDRIVKSIYLLREKIVDGIIFSGGIIHGYEPLSALNELKDRVVVIGRHEVNFPAVVVDNIGGAALATQHLIDLKHTRIGFIGGPQNSTTGIDRLTGYKSTLAQNGYPYDECLVRRGNLTPKSGYQAAARLLSEKDRPSAIFAANDQMAFGTIYAAREMGLRVPEDLAVVGFDNVPLSSYFVPSLSTVEIPMNSLGAAAMDLLINLMANHNFSRMKWFKTRLIARESTAPKKN
ncbi:MAG: LacI family DNA-binding transcriptional regulator [Thermodesulfobacteriota bacterium]